MDDAQVEEVLTDLNPTEQCEKFLTLLFDGKINIDLVNTVFWKISYKTLIDYTVYRKLLYQTKSYDNKGYMKKIYKFDKKGYMKKLYKLISENKNSEMMRWLAEAYGVGGNSKKKK